MAYSFYFIAQQTTIMQANNDNQVHTLTPQQLQQWQAENHDFVLLDVREDNEVQLVSLPGHIHIAMNLIPLRHNELPDDQPIVVYCHHGVRSMQVAQYLAQVGFDDLYSLAGGIDAWSKEIDPTLPQY